MFCQKCGAEIPDTQVPKQNRLKPSKYKGLSLSVCMAYWGLFLREKNFLNILIS